jgi:YesN/AraC family two-component response regulator
MVVEDEALILDHLVSKIEALPLPLVVSATATNGEDAFRLIEQAPPDIVFTDIRMPLMNGLELSQRIHERYPSVAVVIISGYNEFEYARQALRYNVSDYLLKPTTRKLLSIASNAAASCPVSGADAAGISIRRSRQRNESESDARGP